MANFNKTILIGNLTREIELRQTQSGTAVGKFGLAINRKMTRDGQTQESTCFVDCVAFGKQAELLAQYVGKGDPLFVDGRLNYSTWEAKDGGKRSKLEVIVENFQFMGGRSSGEGDSGGRREPRANSHREDMDTRSQGGPDYGGIPF